MKILHIFPHPIKKNVDVLSQSVPGLVAGQSEIGLEVGLLSSAPLLPDVPIVEIPGVCILRSPPKKHRNPWFISHDWIDRIQKEFGIPDLVHFHFIYDSFQCALARNFIQKGWPYITTPRGSLTRLAQHKKRTRKKIANFLYYNSFLKHAAAVHTLCKNEANDLEAFLIKKNITIPNGIDDHVLHAAKSLLPADIGDFNNNNSLLLGFVGRIDVYHKGLDLLIEAMAIANTESNNSNYKLFVVGPFLNKQNQKEFYSKIRRFKQKANVLYLGPKYDDIKLRHFLACDLFVHTSRFEGMPMGVLESMAMGRACLVTPGTNITDVVCEGGGWKCEPDPRSISKSLKEIYKQKNSLKTRGQQAYQLIQSRFSWRNIAEQLRKEYKIIIE